jgi:hypothetical protein
LFGRSFSCFGLEAQCSSAQVIHYDIRNILPELKYCNSSYDTVFHGKFVAYLHQLSLTYKPTSISMLELGTFVNLVIYDTWRGLMNKRQALRGWEYNKTSNIFNKDHPYDYHRSILSIFWIPFINDLLNPVSKSA